MSHESHENGNQEARLHYLDPQEVFLEPFGGDGYILDIGGGGDGVIGRLEGRRVIAIDTSEDELRDAPQGPLKIVMDGSDLKFLAGTFTEVTAFFSLMYIPLSLYPRIFSEVYRVLTPGGRFLIWDVQCPPRRDPGKDILVIPLTLNLPDSQLSTGYGAAWPEEGRNIGDFTSPAEAAGFRIETVTELDSLVTVVLTKPLPLH
jgi:SAM-dependent methyltransferase